MQNLLFDPPPQSSVPAFLGDYDNYIVSINPRDLPGHIIPLCALVFLPSLESLSEAARGYYKEGLARAKSKKVYLVAYRGCVDPALCRLVVVAGSPYPAANAAERLQEHAAQWQIQVERTWHSLRGHEEEQDYIQALHLQDIPMSSSPGAVSKAPPPSLSAWSPTPKPPAKAATKQAPKPMPLPACSSKPLAEAPMEPAQLAGLDKHPCWSLPLPEGKRMPPGFAPHELPPGWPNVSGALEVLKKRWEVEKAKAPPAPPAPSQSTQGPAKDKSFLTRNGDLGFHLFRPGLGGCRGGRWGGLMG